MKPVHLSHAARHDRDNITIYTIDQFGLARAEWLREQLEAQLRLIGEHPHIGQRVPHYDPPGRPLRYRPFARRLLIAYEPTDSAVNVVRILHSSRDVAALLRDH